MRILLAALLLFPGIALADEGDGRYQLVQVPAPIGSVLVDSKTGQTWALGLSDNGTVLTPIKFDCGNKQTLLPCSSPPPKSKIEYIDK